MPSALENLIKILKQEKEQGCEDRAVSGGLAEFSETWLPQAEAQARRPEHIVLADEMASLMQGYHELDSIGERHKTVDYMLDRIVGRQPIPDEYANKLDDARMRLPDAPITSSGAKREQRMLRPRDVHRMQTAPPTDWRKTKGPESLGMGLEPAAQLGELDIKPMPTLARPPRKPRPQYSYDEATTLWNELDGEITQVKGIGPGIAQSMSKLGLHTCFDMINYLPRRYDNYTQFAFIKDIHPGTLVTIIGTVRHTEVRIGRGSRKDFVITVGDDTGTIHVTFFGQHFLSRKIRKGQQLVMNGKVTIYRNALQMTNPEWEKPDPDMLQEVKVVPIYPLTEGITAKAARRNIQRVVEHYADKIPDYIPEATLDRTDLADIGWMYKQLHMPEGEDHLNHAERRYTFDQLLLLQLAILANRREWQSEPGIPLDVTDDFLEGFITSVFPYELTGAQQRAIADIRRDVAQAIPMNRLVQGDVGSGKTAVATVAMAMALANGKQAALMAPTSILAEQHYRGLEETFAQMPGDEKPVIALLTGVLTKTERESVYRGLADGSIDVAVGTHALIQEGVAFNDLAVAVIDEQHRFGVEQRGALRGKGNNPHLLVMTATPIPRTLALTMYADLDLSIIDEKPPGRQPVETRVLFPNEREMAYSFIEGQIRQERQAFIIHPLVEDSETVDARSAMTAYEELQQVFYQNRVCLLHGRMSPTEKDEVMTAFANHDYDIMVTTSVAEVGVNIPNASVIMIEGANRFGLAQLHQFRGRVGRGAHKSFCILIPDNKTDESEQRLQALVDTNDGFVLAEKDWQLRGAGDLIGTRQSGSHILQVAQVATPDLVALAQREARTIYEEDPWLEQEQHQLLAARVAYMHTERNSDVS